MSASTLGFKAIAYPVVDASLAVSPCLCSLAFRCDEGARQATLLLVVGLPQQRFVLQYDADAVAVPAERTVSLTSGNDFLPAAQLDGLARNRHSAADIKTLTLGVARPPPLWCPTAESPLHPPPCQAVELSRANTIHIVFDHKFLQRPYHGMFRAFARAECGLTGIVIDRLLTARGLRKASWDEFGPVDATGAPPAYNHTARKRPRAVSSTSPRQSPSPKRTPKRPLQYSQSPASSEKTVPLSPDAIAALHRALGSCSPRFDFQTAAIDAAVARHLPAALDHALPTLLRDLLPSLFTVTSPPLPPSSPRASLFFHSSSARPSSPISPNASAASLTELPQPHQPPQLPHPHQPHQPRGPHQLDQSPQLHPCHQPCQPPHPPQPPTLTPLAHALLPHLVPALTPHLQHFLRAELTSFQRLLSQLHNAAYSDRARESAFMTDDIEDFRSEMTLLRGDAVADLETEVDEALERARERVHGVLEDALEEVDTGVGRVVENVLSQFEQRARQVCRGVVGSEAGKEARRRRRMGPRCTSKITILKGEGAVKRERANSGGAALLGRKREADEVEWVDC